jgi:hypothetical protein
LSEANKELIASRKELMAEKLKSSALLQTLNIAEMQVTNFVNSQIKRIQGCADETNLKQTQN